jgi:hypothetical protein
MLRCVVGSRAYLSISQTSKDLYFSLRMLFGQMRNRMTLRLKKRTDADVPIRYQRKLLVRDEAVNEENSDDWPSLFNNSP